MKKIFTILAVSLFAAVSAMAQLPYNTTMTGDHYNDATIVQSSGKNGWDNGIRLGDVNGGGFNYNDKYVVVALSNNGIAKKISCNTEAKSISAITPPTDIVFYIAWSADNNEFTTLEAKEAKTNSFDVALPKEAKYIKLCYSGNFGGYFRDIVVEELVYSNAPEHNVWEPIGTIGDEAMLGETTMVWGSTEPFELTLTGEGASQFTVAIDNNAGKGKEGVALISAIYKLDVAGVHEAVLTVANGTYSYEIALKGTTLKKEQTLVWNDDLSNLNALDTVVLNATAMTEVSYAVSDENVASVEGNKLIAHRAGEVVVYAYATESDMYKADTLSLTAVVSTIAQEMVWDQDLSEVNVFDTIVLSAAAKNEVTYAVSDSAIASVEGNVLVLHNVGEVVVYAYAAESEQYKADTLAKMVVVNPLIQEIIWTLDSTQMTVGDTLMLNAVATSGLEVSYVVDIDSVVVIENGQLIAIAAGEVVLTATQAGDKNYLAAEDVVYTITVLAKEEEEGGDDVTTNMDYVGVDNRKVARKIVRDGQIYIIRGEEVYSVLGNRL